MLAYARLVRLPNAFTALADIALGLAATGYAVVSPVAAVALALASVALYSAGMVLNDLFDLAQDRRERPFRPLPSGAISSRTAAVLGSGLLLAGIGLAAFAGALSPDGWTRPFVTALLLAACIALYDAGAKRTGFGPVAMGGCRFLNILLGLSLASDEVVPWPLRLHLAGAVGVFIVGVTWFARTEARASERWQLRSAALVMLAGWLLALWVPGRLPVSSHAVSLPYLWAVAVVWLGGPIWNACRDPQPGPVQAAVKRCIFGLVPLDALLATACVGPFALLILLLLAPARWLGRRIYST